MIRAADHMHKVAKENAERLYGVELKAASRLVEWRINKRALDGFFSTTVLARVEKVYSSETYKYYCHDNTVIKESTMEAVIVKLVDLGYLVERQEWGFEIKW